MKKQITIFTLLSSVLLSAALMQSCKKDKDDDEPDPALIEIIATNATFAGYTSWPLEFTFNGADSSLGGAHAGNDSTAIRKIYFKDGVDPVGGVYPLGSVIVKHSTNAAGTLNEYTGMVKRGNGFNPSCGDWEFFMLNANGTIATNSSGEIRGANIASAFCRDCHIFATSSKDFIYSK